MLDPLEEIDESDRQPGDPTAAEIRGGRRWIRLVGFLDDRGVLHRPWSAEKEAARRLCRIQPERLGVILGRRVDDRLLGLDPWWKGEGRWL
jgi:hypothetical protein